MRQANGHHAGDKRVLLAPTIVTPRHAAIDEEPPLAAIERVRAPTGRERTFNVDDIIVSKTDLAGRITYANDVFLEVSGYTEAEVLRQPHSILRHPDMPRCIFKLLWDHVQSGREIFAYVVNLTKNGDHYWVFAHVTPTFDENGTITGYHSNRRCPDRAQVNRVRPLYEQLLAAEREHARKADAIAASIPLLERAVAERHRTYEEFVFSI